MKSINAEEVSSIKAWSTSTLSGMWEELARILRQSIQHDPEGKPSMQYPRSQERLPRRYK